MGTTASLLVPAAYSATGSGLMVEKSTVPAFSLTPPQMILHGTMQLSASMGKTLFVMQIVTRRFNISDYRRFAAKTFIQIQYHRERSVLLLTARFFRCHPC